MRVDWMVKAAAVLAIVALAPAAFAQWNLSWYVDTEEGSGNLVIDDATSNPVLEGGAVYLIADTNGDGFQGLTANGAFVSADDQLVLVNESPTEIVRGQMGENDIMFNPQGDGEFNFVHSLSDDLAATGNVELYALAFNTWVDYNSGVSRFMGNALWGVSVDSFNVASVTQDEYMDFGQSAWSTDTQLIPEPATVAMMVAGLGGVMAYRRKKKS